MLETSKDLFFVVLAFCILWGTVVFTWMLYYVISMLRDVSKITSGARAKFELIDSILHLAKDKLEKSSSHMAILADSAMKIVTMVIDKKTTAKKKKK